MTRIARVAWPCLFVATSLAWAGAGCGYQMESPRLPNDRHSIGVEPVYNRTYEAELDVRMQEELRRRLYRDPAIRVTPPERSELVLNVELQDLTLSRSRSLDSTDIRAITLSLRGVMSLRDAASGELIYDRQPVAVSSRYDLPDSALETPAVRDDALSTVLTDFADQIVRQLLLTF